MTIYARLDNAVSGPVILISHQSIIVDPDGGINTELEKQVLFSHPSFDDRQVHDVFLFQDPEAQIPLMQGSFQYHYRVRGSLSSQPLFDDLTEGDVDQIRSSTGTSIVTQWESGFLGATDSNSTALLFSRLMLGVHFLSESSRSSFGFMFGGGLGLLNHSEPAGTVRGDLFAGYDVNSRVKILVGPYVEFAWSPLLPSFWSLGGSLRTQVMLVHRDNWNLGITGAAFMGYGEQSSAGFVGGFSAGLVLNTLHFQ